MEDLRYFAESKREKKMEIKITNAISGMAHGKEMLVLCWTQESPS